jgi:hypothetical protein
LTTVIIITLIAVILYFLFWNKKTGRIPSAVTKDAKSKIKEIDINELEVEKIYNDENGQFKLAYKTSEIPRRTYLKANLNGKYWGVIDEDYSNNFEYSKFFDFNFYEVSLKNAVYDNIPFQLQQDFRIPREKLPKLLHTVLVNDGKEYAINLQEPVFADIKFNRKLHQDEGHEVFGTIDAVVTGYILDFVKETYFEKLYILPVKEPFSIPKIVEPLLTKTNTPSGNSEHNGNYKRTEYFYSNYRQTYWGEWKYTKPPIITNNEGCFSSVISLLAGIFGIAFVLMILPQMAFVFPFLLILFLLNLIPTRFFSWFSRLIGILFFLGFIISLFHYFYNTSKRAYIPKRDNIEQPEERNPQIVPIIDTLDNKAERDTLIRHLRVWQDFDGNKYEGTIWTRKSDFTKAKYFKNNLILNSNTSSAYDEMIFRLKENDKNNLNGVYQLFDSIKQNQQLTNVKFAELIVSYVQDIPYTVIVPEDCNPNLYEDKFIKEYLTSEHARCDGFEKFGINSPVEFMSSLNGDCDTRTLFLYTILAHYGYDVALFSSEYYRHSIIGVNLPLSGIAYQYQNHRYVLWETTAPNIKAGILPAEISNLNYWRISLKSK